MTQIAKPCYLLEADKPERLRKRRSAFERAADEEDEKEVLLLSRRLGLTAEQEQSVADIYRQAAETFAKEEQEMPRDANTPAAGQQLQRYLETVKKRRQFIDDRVKPLLSQEQFRAYSEFQAQSAEQDMQLWHGKE